MEIDIESLERATLDAVAPVAMGTLPGWLLPFDVTTIGRCISAVPLSHKQIDPTVIEHIESNYAQHGLTPQFRIADVADLSGLHKGLLAHGYTAQQPTLTMVGNVNSWPQTQSGMAVQLSSQATENWKSVYLSKDFDPVDGANRVSALSRSTCTLYACLTGEAGPIAAGTAAFSQGWVSLHGFRTHSQERGKGYASALIAALGKEAKARGIERCFLQVEEDNAAAISLYLRLGLRTAWRYHYWRKLPQAAWA